MRHNTVLHNEAKPGVLALLSPKPERLCSFIVSRGLLDSRGFDEEDDGRDSKRCELHDESSKLSFCFSPVEKRFVYFIFIIHYNCYGYVILILTRSVMAKKLTFSAR